MAGWIARALTPGERAAAAGVFGPAIDHARVRVHNRKAYFFQPADTAITPNGEIYFPPGAYLADFSIDLASSAWLIHELTHVWQYQHGVWVRLQGILHREYGYGDLTGADRAFASFHIEQQASIVEDYFRMTHGARPRRGTGALADYRRIIPFLPERGQ